MTLREYLYNYEIKNNVKTLLVYGHDLSDIYGIEKLSKLEYIEIQRNHISDIEPLKYLKKMRVLHCGNNLISDITSLKNSNIETLSIKSNNISNIDVILSMDKLSRINLFDNPIKFDSYPDDVFILNQGLYDIKKIIMYERRKRLINQL